MPSEADRRVDHRTRAGRRAPRPAVPACAAVAIAVLLGACGGGGGGDDDVGPDDPVRADAPDAAPSDPAPATGDAGAPAGDASTEEAPFDGEPLVGPPDVEGSAFLYTANNSALFDASALDGLVLFDAYDSRPLAVDRERTGGDLVIEGATLHGHSQVSTVTFAVANRGNATVCGPRVKEVSFRREDGSRIGRFQRDVRVYGSAARFDGTVIGAGCLASGEIGHASLTHSGAPYANVAHVRVEGTEHAEGVVEPIGGNVPPIAFDVVAQTRDYVVTARNDLGFAIRLRGGQLTALDADGYPVANLPMIELSTVEPGEEFTYFFSVDAIPPATRAVRAVVDYVAAP